MPVRRFVVQEHSTAREGVHWDLMIEQGPSLMTFRLELGPEAIGGEPVPAVRIFDHDLRFLTYEGPVQKGTGRVRIVDCGQCLDFHPEKELLTFLLQGQVLNGDVELRQIRDDMWHLTLQGGNHGA